MDQSLNKVMKLVEELQEIEIQDLRRGPYLAVVEIEKRRLMLKIESAGGEQEVEKSPLVTSILAYFERCERP